MFRPVPPPVCQDFTTYTETDPSNRLTQTASRSTWTGLRRGDGGTTVLMKDLGVGYVSLDFVFEFILEMTAIEAGDVDERHLISHGFSNNSDLLPVAPVCGLAVREVGADDTRFFIRTTLNHDGDPLTQVDSINLDVGTTYYMRWSRTNLGRTVTLDIYSDALRTVLVDSVVNINAEFVDLLRYIRWPFRSFSAVDSSDWSSGYTEDLCEV